MLSIDGGLGRKRSVHLARCLIILCTTLTRKQEKETALEGSSLGLGSWTAMADESRAAAGCDMVTIGAGECYH